MFTNIAEEKPIKSGGPVQVANLNNLVYVPFTAMMKDFGSTSIKRSSGSFEAIKVEVDEAIVSVAREEAIIPVGRILQRAVSRTHPQNDYEIVVRGLASMLAPYRDRVCLVELGTEDTPSEGADVALFDTFAGRRHTLARAAAMLRSGRVGHVVLYTWDAGPELVKAAKEMGVAGVVLKTRSADALVDSLERIVRGEMVGLNGEGEDGPSRGASTGTDAGRDRRQERRRDTTVVTS